MENSAQNNLATLHLLKKNQVVISVGSNTEDKIANVTGILDFVRENFGGVRCSSVYETPCYTGKGNDYANAVVIFSNTKNRTLQELETQFKQLEESYGRTHGENRHIVVPLDIDIIIFENQILRSKDFERYYFTQGYEELMTPAKINIADYVYDLPDNLIALHPLKERDLCKLLVCNEEGVLADTIFNRIGEYLPDDSLLVYNDTRVINARLHFHKESGARIQIFCLEPVSPADYQLNFASTKPVEWKCLVGNSKKWKEGKLSTEVLIGENRVVLQAERLKIIDGDSIVRFSWDDSKVSFSEIIEAAGEIPIPPYLNRSSEESDKEDYQTVYSCMDGSVAAPTAGLHFTQSLLEQLAQKGIKKRNVTLHVGAGTFQPIKAATIGDHNMHSELIDVSRDLIIELAETYRPVTAVGTTTVRTLESLYHIGCLMATGKWEGSLSQWYPYHPDHPQLSVREALMAIVNHLDTNNLERLITSTQIIIAPAYKYRVVGNLITNFHQPGSTLLLLVAAIVGEKWHDIYRHAIANQYRFLSYGDACLFLNI